MEKRVPIAIVVHLARAEDHTAQGPELTYTDNISGHGAGVISSRQWKAGEIAEVTSLNDRITLRGRVAYCAKREDGRYDVGLCFNEQEVTWNPDVKYADLLSGKHPLRGLAAVTSFRSGLEPYLKALAVKRVGHSKWEAFAGQRRSTDHLA